MLLAKSKYINILRLLRNERRSPDELINHQNIKLKKLVKHAYTTVKFYKDLFDNSRLHPDDIQSIDDISRIPIIDKEVLNQNRLDDLISEEYKRKELVPVTTSGSSGLMLKFFIDKSFDQFRKAQFVRPYITNGKTIFDKTLLFSPPKPAVKKWFQHFGIMNVNRVYYNESTIEQIKAICSFKPAVIQGCSSLLNLLSVIILDKNFLIPKPRLVYTDSEVLTRDMRTNIEKAFGGEVFDIYGTYETDNIGYECSLHNGYHIAIDSVVMEFICDGRKALPDEEAEIVVTVLNNFAMPFIRYNLHDLGSYSSRSCSCGRTFPLLNNIKGRSDDYLITADGNKLSFVTLGAYWHPLINYVHEYQLIQEDLNSFSIYIVPNNNFNEECKVLINSEIKKHFPAADIDFKIVPAIKRERSGKFMTFKSKVSSLTQNI